MATVNYIPYKKQSAFTMRGVMMYVSLPEKTLLQDEGYKLITGINCCAETAVSEFTATKARYKKNDQVQFYHYTQSFKVGLDISPQQAHEIALEFAQKTIPIMKFWSQLIPMHHTFILTLLSTLSALSMVKSFINPRTLCGY